MTWTPETLGRELVRLEKEQQSCEEGCQFLTDCKFVEVITGCDSLCLMFKTLLDRLNEREEAEQE